MSDEDDNFDESLPDLGTGAFEDVLAEPEGRGEEEILTKPQTDLFRVAHVCREKVIPGTREINSTL